MHPAILVIHQAERIGSLLYTLYSDQSIFGLVHGAVRVYKQVFLRDLRMARGSVTLQWVLTRHVTRGSALLILCGRYTFFYVFELYILPLQTLRRGVVRGRDHPAPSSPTRHTTTQSQIQPIKWIPALNSENTTCSGPLRGAQSRAIGECVACVFHLFAFAVAEPQGSSL